jgi:ribosome-binding factor A
MPADRMRRVNEAVRAVVAEAVGELKDPRIGLVTVTGVSVTRDLREGTVYIAVHGNERKQRATLEGLDSAHSYLQARVARELRMKRTPHLSFEYDPSVERGIRMTKLIDEVTPGDGADDTRDGGESASE